MVETEALPEGPKQRKISDSLPLFYSLYFNRLRRAARECGYALAVHGSMQTDFDLLAMPWIHSAADPKELIEALRAVISGYIDTATDCNPENKPFGRLAWSVYFNELRAGPYLDVSVAPKFGTAEKFQGQRQLVLRDDATGTRGDCWRACIATLAHVPAENVPHFVQDEADGGPELYEATGAWLKDLGFRLEMDSTAPNEGLVIIGDKSPRYGLHAVVGDASVRVFRGGEWLPRVVHDPHPSQAGIIHSDPRYYWLAATV